VLRWIRSRLWVALKTSVVRWSSDGGSLHSAALAYYAACSLFPLCLLLIAALGVVTKISGQVQDQQRQALDLVGEHVGPWFADQLRVLLRGVADDALVGGSLGILTFVVAGLAIFVQLETMCDSIWSTSEKTSRGLRTMIWSIVRERLTAFVMLVGVGMLIVALFVANMAISGGRHFVVRLPWSEATWTVAQWVAAIMGNAILLTFVFRTIPRAPVRWREAFCGGLLAALILQIGQHILALFVISNRYSVYGVVGSFVAIMVWLYYASVVVFFAAEFVRALAPDSARDGPPTEPQCCTRRQVR
jgi:membrane protein